MATMADSKTRRSFTDAYKTGAVRLVLDEGKTVAAALSISWRMPWLGARYIVASDL